MLGCLPRRALWRVAAQTNIIHSVYVNYLIMLTMCTCSVQRPRPLVTPQGGPWRRPWVTRNSSWGSGALCCSCWVILRDVARISITTAQSAGPQARVTPQGDNIPSRGPAVLTRLPRRVLWRVICSNEFYALVYMWIAYDAGCICESIYNADHVSVFSAVPWSPSDAPGWPPGDAPGWL